MTKEQLEERIDLIILNTILEGPGLTSGVPYNYIQEAIKWAETDVYFEGKTSDEILATFREYDTWNAFEAECLKLNPPS